MADHTLTPKGEAKLRKDGREVVLRITFDRLEALADIGINLGQGVADGVEPIANPITRVRKMLAIVADVPEDEVGEYVDLFGFASINAAAAAAMTASPLLQGLADGDDPDEPGEA